MEPNQLTELSPETRQKWDQLLQIIKNLQSTVVAYSGGVDSSLLSVAAYQTLGERMLAVTIRSSVEVDNTYEVARAVSEQFHFPHQMLDFDDLDSPTFTANPPERCYFCKQMDFTEIKNLAAQKGLQYVLEGSNADDLTDYRPGRKAALELGVLSPLVDAGLKKVEIRQIARALGLPNWDRPSSPCLASRFPYGTPITREGLQKVARGEAFLQENGFRIVRTRYDKASVRIEVAPAEIQHLLEKRQEVLSFFKGLGYKYVLLDLEGYRMGSLNEVLPQ